MGIGSKLNALLIANGKKPGTLASETGINKNTIYSILKRDNDKVDMSILERIADNMNISVDYFFQKDDNLSFTVEELRLLSMYRRADNRAKMDALLILQSHISDDDNEFDELRAELDAATKNHFEDTHA